MCQVEQISKPAPIRQLFVVHSGTITRGDRMNNSAKAWFMAFVMGVLLPGVIFSVSEKIISRGEREQQIESTVAATEPVQVSEVTVLLADGQVQMDMQTYLTGVLLAEMPVDFSEEALKAQAVVSRTYALRRNSLGNKHPQGAVCTESSCCQAYRAIDDFLSKGGTEEMLKKVSQAVGLTDNQVLTYNGALIEATYFSCSGGRTEDAVAVWGTEIPYLQAVDSPGEEGATHFVDTVEFTTAEFVSLLGISPKESAVDWLGAVTYTDGGGVDRMMIGGKLFSGTEIRQKLGLRSTAFSVHVTADKVYISTRGFGHRVGMSQYGAEAMAVQGSDYQEILYHYYPGTQLTVYCRN